MFRATLGFNFIFAIIDGAKIPFCIEINGEDTGLKRVEKIPAGDLTTGELIRVKNRMIHTSERLELFKYAESISRETRLSDSKEAWVKARAAHGFVHAFYNTDFINEITDNKILQQEFIPKTNCPRQYKEDGFNISFTGFWICKPVSGRKGRGIKIISNSEFEDFIKTENSEGLYLAQEFVKVCGDDKYVANMKNNSASLRLLMDFVYFEDRSIEEVFTFSYQRIFISKKVKVVNLATGAISSISS